MRESGWFKREDIVLLVFSYFFETETYYYYYVILMIMYDKQVCWSIGFWLASLWKFSPMILWVLTSWGVSVCAVGRARQVFVGFGCWIWSIFNWDKKWENLLLTKLSGFNVKFQLKLRFFCRWNFVLCRIST